MKFVVAAFGATIAVVLNFSLALSPPQPSKPILERINAATDVIVGTPKRVVYIDSKDQILDTASQLALSNRRIALEILVHRLDYSRSRWEGLSKNQLILVSFASLGTRDALDLEVHINKQMGFLIRSYKSNRNGVVVNSFDAKADPLAIDSVEWEAVQEVVRSRASAKPQPSGSSTKIQ